MSQTSREDALAFLKQENVGVLATLSPDGHPRARFVYYASDEDLNIYFLTYKNTRKVADLEANSHAAFVVGNESVPKSMQIEGTVTDVTNEPTSDKTIHELFARLQSNSEYGAPLTHLDTSALRFYKLSPTWIRFGDFTTTATKSKDVFEEIQP